MRVVDFHTHFCSRPFFNALADLSPLTGDRNTLLAHVREETGYELPPADLGAHVQRWVSALDECGVEHMMTFASVPEEIPAVTEGMRLAKGRISGVAVVNPRLPKCEEEVWTLLTEGGFSGLLFFPALYRFRVNGKEAEAALKVAEEESAIVFVYSGLLLLRLRDLLGLTRTLDLSYADPIDVIAAANRFPRARFLIPHFGGGFFRETLLAGAQCENVYVVSSCSQTWLRTQPERLTLREAFQRTLDVFGARRLLFGTDSSFFPPGWRKDHYEEQRAILDDLGIAPEKQQLIFAGNAMRMLGVHPPGEDLAGA